MSSIQSRYPCELVTHAFFKPVSRLKQSIPRNYSEFFGYQIHFKYCRSSQVWYFCWALRSAWEQVLTAHLWNTPAAARQEIPWSGREHFYDICAYRPVSWFRWDHSFVSGRWQCLGSLQCPEEVQESNYCSTNMLQFKNTSASNHPSAEVLTSNTILPQNT